jgi:hypothetical protein
MAPTKDNNQQLPQLFGLFAHGLKELRNLSPFRNDGYTASEGKLAYDLDCISGQTGPSAAHN